MFMPEYSTLVVGEKKIIAIVFTTLINNDFFHCLCPIVVIGTVWYDCKNSISAVPVAGIRIHHMMFILTYQNHVNNQCIQEGFDSCANNFFQSKKSAS